MRSIVFTQYCRVAFGDAALRYELPLIMHKSIAKINIRFPIIYDLYCITNIVNFCDGITIWQNLQCDILCVVHYFS